MWGACVAINWYFQGWGSVDWGTRIFTPSPLRSVSFGLSPIPLRVRVSEQAWRTRLKEFDSNFRKRGKTRFKHVIGAYLELDSCLVNPNIMLSIAKLRWFIVAISPWECNHDNYHFVSLTNTVSPTDRTSNPVVPGDSLSRWINWYIKVRDTPTLRLPLPSDRWYSFANW